LLAVSDLDEIAAYVFIDIAVIVIVARLMGMLFRRIRQPPVVGEIIAGILLGPTLLGAFPGDLDKDLFPLEVRPFLSIVAQLGLILFMFIVGLELDVNLIRGNERTAAVVSIASIVLPFGLGFLLAVALYGSHDIVGGEKIDYLPFALFIGASMSITAFPVLARILTDRGMHRTAVGALTLACAAVDDIIAWTLLAVVIAVVEATGALDVPRIIIMSAIFAAVMFLVVRPLLARLVDRYRQVGRLTPNILSIILIGVLVSSYITAKIGIHQIFGAFLFGAIMPREHAKEMFHEILERLEQVSVLLLLPVFFIATGLNVDVRGIGLSGTWQLALILLVAIGGKFIGATAGARLQGVAPRKASAIGILMNTRGLTELVILNVGLSIGVLDQQLFTLLVVMALVTTIMTEPLLRIVYPDHLLQRDVADAEKAALAGPDAYRVLVAVDDPEAVGPLVDLAADMIGPVQPSEIVLSRFLPLRQKVEVGSGLTGELADMATAMDALNALGRRAEQRGIRAVVLSQFSTDVAHDLIEQAQTVDADVVLLRGTGDDESAETVRALVAAAPADVGVFVGDDGRDGPVAATLGEAPDDGAAIEMAVRIAKARGAELRLLDPRGGGKRGRVAPLVKAIERAGVDASTDGAATGASLVVTGFGEEAGADLAAIASGLGRAVLVCRAKEALAPEGARERMAKLADADKE